MARDAALVARGDRMLTQGGQKPRTTSSFFVGLRGEGGPELGDGRQAQRRQHHRQRRGVNFTATAAANTQGASELAVC